MINSKVKEMYKNSAFFRIVNSLISIHFRRKLRNANFTILCPNCIGGIIYNRLGQRFLSPTINMWFTQPDFVKFLLHLDDYLADDLRFISTNMSYPVTELGDGMKTPIITLHFNHASSRDEAEGEWNKRKYRVNKDNLYIILYKLDGLTLEEIHLLDNYPCKNKVIFTQSPLPNVEWSYCIIPNMKSMYPSAYLGKDIWGIRWYEKKWDFVDFLNS